jgi:thiol-disulfide isomerase/thioredoxin
MSEFLKTIWLIIRLIFYIVLCIFVISLFVGCERQYEVFTPNLQNTSTSNESCCECIEETPEEVQNLNGSYDFEFKNFQETLDKHRGQETHFYVLIGAEWCGPCKVLKDRIVKMNPDGDFVYIDYDIYEKEKPEWNNFFYDNRPRRVPLFLRLRATDQPKIWIREYWDNNVAIEGFIK